MSEHAAKAARMSPRLQLWTSMPLPSTRGAAEFCRTWMARANLIGNADEFDGLCGSGGVRFVFDRNLCEGHKLKGS
jgi:hypothetical protein